jgi:hypothetical protein
VGSDGGNLTRTCENHLHVKADIWRENTGVKMQVGKVESTVSDVSMTGTVSHPTSRDPISKKCIYS